MQSRSRDFFLLKALGVPPATFRVNFGDQTQFRHVTTKMEERSPPTPPRGYPLGYLGGNPNPPRGWGSFTFGPLHPPLNPSPTFFKKHPGSTVSSHAWEVGTVCPPTNPRQHHTKKTWHRKNFDVQIGAPGKMGTGDGHHP